MKEFKKKGVPAVTPGAATAAAAPTVSALDGSPVAPGFEVRFLKPADSASDKKAAAAAAAHVAQAHPELELATPVIIGTPHGHRFDTPVRLTAPLKGGPATVAKVLHKAGEDAPWTT